MEVIRSVSEKGFQAQPAAILRTTTRKLLIQCKSCDPRPLRSREHRAITADAAIRENCETTAQEATRGHTSTAHAAAQAATRIHFNSATAAHSIAIAATRD